MFYYRFLDDEAVMQMMRFLNMFESEQIYSWTRNESVYFRHIPYLGDFLVVLTMAVLIEINRVYLDESTSDKDDLMEKASKYLRDRYF